MWGTKVLAIHHYPPPIHTHMHTGYGLVKCIVIYSECEFKGPVQGFKGKLLHKYDYRNFGS